MTSPDDSVHAVERQLAASLAKLHGELNDADMATAHRAGQEALALVERLLPITSPWAAHTDEGIVMLEWRHAETGVALLLSGDGSVLITESTEAHGYLAAPIEPLIANLDVEALRDRIAKHVASPPTI